MGFLSKGALVSGALAFGVFYSIFTYVVLTPLDAVAEELEKSLDEATKKELAEQSGSWFIPFPGTTKQLQPRPYRGSDPEWQEYVKFSKDPALGKRVRDELAALIKTTIEKTPMLTMRCGKDIKLRRYWLDVDFPQTPPPEFERSGIEIADDYIAWTTMPVDSLTVFRLRQALWPSALVQSLWTFSKVLVKQETSIVAGMLGMHTRPPPSLENIFSKHAKNAATQPGKIEQLSKAEPRSSGRPTADSQPLDASSTTDKASPDPSNALANAAEKTDSEMSNSIPAFSPVQIHLLQAYMAFQTKFAQTWRPAPSYPPRGSILVSGLVELDSPKAWLVIDVKAAWDPKTKTYDARSMQVVMRRLQMKKQGPLG